MKQITLSILMLFPFLSFSQGSSSTDISSRFEFSAAVGQTGIFYNKPKEIVGNIYVFENWSNKCVVFIGGEAYKLNNINLNMKTDRFEAQIGKDSMFAFNTSNIDHFYINNRKFKSFNIPEQSKDRNFEIIYDGNDLKVLKGFEVGVKYNDPDPLMVRKNVDNYFTTITYYIKNGEDISEIKLKKKSILHLFNDKADQLSNYIKENKLSYKSEKDLNKMFIYYESL